MSSFGLKGQVSAIFFKQMPRFATMQLVVKSKNFYCQ